MGHLPLTAFLVGLLGGVHCVAMCGGVVSAYTLVRMPVTNKARRPRLAGPWAAQWLFNGGRIASYAAAGTLAGGLSGAGVAAARLLPMQTMLFVVANGLLILLGLYLAGRGRFVLAFEGAGALLWRAVRPAVRRIPASSSPLGRAAAGMVWGWTPCGLVYSALALALVSGGAANGAMVMAAFGLGTLPSLLGAGWLLSRFGSRFQHGSLRTLAGVAVAAFGVVGIMRVPGLVEHIRSGLLCLG